MRTRPVGDSKLFYLIMDHRRGRPLGQRGERPFAHQEQRGGRPFGHREQRGERPSGQREHQRGEKPFAHREQRGERQRGHARGGRRRKYPFRIGLWTPENESAERQWRDEIIKTARETSDIPLHPIVKDFQDEVEKDNSKLSQTSERQGKDFREMFRLINFVMQRWAPQFNEHGVVNFPMSGILKGSKGTANGRAFLNEKASKHWKRVLDHWGKYLESSASTYVLVDKPWGWFGKKAMEKMPNFVEEFECDPSKPHYGFKSWDDFFTRKFRKGVRPIAEGSDVIASACESVPFDIQSNIQLTDDFWIKEHKYSLRHMLNDDPFAEKFIGGTFYQGIVSAVSFHRWHSPVDGKIVKAYNIPGSYYSPNDEEDDTSEGCDSQIASRAIIFIEADNPAIGLMCFMAAGMSEVSTCEIKHDLFPNSINPTPRVKKGDDIGTFHYGGSTHCLMFSKDVNIEWHTSVWEGVDDESTQNIPVNSRIGVVTA